MNEVSLSKGWSLEAYISHNESMRAESDRRYEQRFDAQERAVQAAMTSAKEAVIKAETASEKRFESVNEFRATLADQASNLISRMEVDQQFKATNEKTDIIMSRMDRLEGRAGGSNATVVYVIAGISVIVGVIGAISTIIVLFTRT